jgi:thioesterase domain-containing protein
MAADRLETLLAFQPRGPYLLGGFCAGGTVAFEMAQQLRQRGQAVDLLLLVDARARNARLRTASRLVNGVASLLRLDAETRRKLFRSVRHFLTALHEARRRGFPDLISFMIRKPSTLAGGVSGRPVTAEPARPTASLNEWQIRWQAHHEALEDYVPQRYPGRLVLLRSAYLDVTAPGDPPAGWQRVSRDVVVQPIAGKHTTCITRHIGDLAAKMSPFLRTSR